jgi:BlaI family transcriptional regulator, penicillinase repressor
MKLVWQRRKATVREVYKALLERREIAYTTVMTMMKILETKCYLKKRRQDRAFVYRPAQPKNKIISAMIREFTDRVFNGSAEAFVAALVKSRQLRKKDLQKSFGWSTKQQTFTARSDGGKGFEKPHSKGGMVSKNLTLKGGKISKKSSRRGPYVSKTDTLIW